MKIASTQYNLDKEALEIYFSGCGFHCVGCHNPELQDFDVGTDFRIAWTEIEKKVRDNPLVKRVWFLGGEPLHQDTFKITFMVDELHELGVEVWLFTGYSFWAIPDHIMDRFDYIKAGQYREELKVEDQIEYGITLASENQHVYKKGVEYGGQD
jgi:anaerobic ribonucleoside-triphosphate reductase activating protein